MPDWWALRHLVCSPSVFCVFFRAFRFPSVIVPGVRYTLKSGRSVCHHLGPNMTLRKSRLKNSSILTLSGCYVFVDEGIIYMHLYMYMSIATYGICIHIYIHNYVCVRVSV